MSIFDEYERHSPENANLYGCMCGWRNPVEVVDQSPDGLPFHPTWTAAEAAQRKHAEGATIAAWWTPEITEVARREVRKVLPDISAGKDATAAIASLSSVLVELPSAPTNQDPESGERGGA